MFIFYGIKKNKNNRSNVPRDNSLNKFIRKRSIESKLNGIYMKLSDNNLNRLAEVIASPRRLFWRSFVAGIARGIGTAIGFSLLSAVLIYFLRYIVMLNLPVIGAFVRDVLEMAERR